MKIVKYSDSDYEALIQRLINRSDVDLDRQDETVRKIIRDVKDNGDKALLDYTHQFDRTNFALGDLEVRPEEIQSAYQAMSKGEVEALQHAADNIRKFHERQIQESWEYSEDDVMLGQLVRPLQMVGIYVPGGKASYPSSVLMNAIPASVAGVEQIVMCSPAPGGETSAHALVAADIAGVSRIFKVGGAQAVAALAYGTATVPRVDKIVGPGNIFVALAKRAVFGLVDIDMIAGPSEILVIADETARPDYVAADLLSQAEHDEQAVPLLVTPSLELAESVARELDRQRQTLKRQEIIDASLQSQCFLIVTEDLASAVELANRMAPEHLELAVEDPGRWLEHIRNAGAIFMGHYTPEAIGDYLAGPNHVLPTSGTARFSSPLGVYDFVKKTSLIQYSREALEKSAESVRILTEMESLDAHANAVKIRVK